MTLLIDNFEIDAARSQFEQHGHVGIIGSYDPIVAHQAADELQSRVGRLRLDQDNNQTATMQGYRGGPNLSLSIVLDGIGRSSASIGRPIWPAPEGSKSFTQIIEMQSGSEGSWHYDRDAMSRAVGITTLRGASVLEIEGDVQYELTPGRVAFLDPARRLRHRGLAVGGSRTGLIVSVMDLAAR